MVEAAEASRERHRHAMSWTEEASSLRGSARARIVAAMVVLFAVSMAAIGALQYSMQLHSMSERVQLEVALEYNELELFRTNELYGRPGTYTDPERLMEDFMRYSVRGPFEAMLSISNGTVVNHPSVSGTNLDRPVVIDTARRLAVPGEPVQHRLVLDGRQLEMLIVEFDRPGGSAAEEYLFVMSADLTGRQGFILEAIRSYVVLSALALVLVAVAGYLIAGRVMQPLVELREATSRIDASDLGRRVSVPRADNDVAALAVRFNGMLDRLQRGFADQQMFLDDAAHELRTPLTIVRGNLETMDPGNVTEVEQVRALAVDEVDRMDRLVDDLLLLARSQRPDFLRWQEVEIDDLAAEAFSRMKALGDREWRLKGRASGVILADRQRLLQAIVQLAANAVKYSNTGDRITLGTRWDYDTERQFLVLSVTDTGVGIAADQLDRIFDRFERVAGGDQDGLGLGLPIVRAIATGHHGSVAVRSHPGRGSTFEIWVAGTSPDLLRSSLPESPAVVSETEVGADATNGDVR